MLTALPVLSGVYCVGQWIWEAFETLFQAGCFAFSSPVRMVLFPDP
jgi:hypothetical protein